MTRNWFVVVAACVLFALAGAAQAGGDVDAGKAKSKKCVACHGADGEGKKDNPPLAGMSFEDHVKAMQDYKSGAREHKMMQKLAKRLSDDDIANMAAYYATLK